MAVRNSSSRNLWIIAALVVVTVAVLAWWLNSGVGVPGSNVADVSVAPPIGGDAAPAAGD